MENSNPTSKILDFLTQGPKIDLKLCKKILKAYFYIYVWATDRTFFFYLPFIFWLVPIDWPLEGYRAVLLKVPIKIPM